MQFRNGRMNRFEALLKAASKASSKKAKGLNWDAAEAEIKVSDEEVSKDAVQTQILASPLFSEADIASMHAIQIEERFRKTLNTEEAAFVEMGAFLTDKLEKLSLIGDYLISKATKPGDVSASYSMRFQSLDALKEEFNKLDQAQERWHQEAAAAQAAEVEEAGEFGNGYMTNQVVHSFDDGWTVVYVPAADEGPNYKGNPEKSNDRTVEGNLNGLCLGSVSGYYQNNDSGKIYSVRDPSNKPGATIRIHNNSLEEAKGKNNISPNVEAAIHADKWLKSRKGLSYKDNLDYIKFPPLSRQLAEEAFKSDYQSAYSKGWIVDWFNEGIPEIDQDVKYKIIDNDISIINAGFHKKYKELAEPVAKFWAEKYINDDDLNIFSKSKEASRIYRKRPWMQAAAEKLFKEDTNRAFFFGLGEIPEFISFATTSAKRLAGDRPYDFFAYGLSDMEPLKYLKRSAAENLAKKNPHGFVELGLHTAEAYMDLTRSTIRSLAKEDPYFFFRMGFHKKESYRDLAGIAAESLTIKDPYYFFEYGLHELSAYRDLSRVAAEGLAKDSPFHFFDHELHLIEGNKDIARIAAENLASESPKLFLDYGLNKIEAYEDLTIIVAESLAKHEPYYFFSYVLHREDAYKDLARIAAEGLAKNRPSAFFGFELHKVDAYKDLVGFARNGLTSEKFASLSRWLIKNGFDKEAEKLKRL